MREHAAFVETVMPADGARVMGERGTGIGIAQEAGQVGKKRPAIKTPLENLYVVGGDAGGSGVGLELCVNSAIDFFDVYVA